MAKLKQEELAQIRERAEEATTGKTAGWYVDEYYSDTVRDSWSGELIAQCIPTMEDAAFIAHAREDIPKLLAEIERLRTQNLDLLEWNRYYFAENKRLKRGGDDG